VNISFEQASDLIGKSKRGENITMELVEMGCKDNRNGASKSNTQSKASKEKEFQTLFDKAYQAGMEAGQKHNPKPMVVSQHSNPLNDNSAVKQSWYVSEGVCGFAWIIVRPGNSSFANWLKKAGKARKDSYYGGVNIWVREFGQSYERKYVFANAFAKVLEEAGINASANSRLD